MLEDLRTRIRALPTFRYFSSSLLVLYDGSVCPEGLGKLEEPPECEKEFQRIIERAKEADKAQINYSYENLQRAENGSVPVKPELWDSAESASATVMSEEELVQARRLVDLRMIDFAHATHKGYNDSIHYEGVDESYLIGLDKLVEMFRDMQQTYCKSGCGLKV
jgi:hypothetical protein